MMSTSLHAENNLISANTATQYSLGISGGSMLGSMWNYVVNHFRRLAIDYFYPYIKKWSFKSYGPTGSHSVIRLTTRTAFKKCIFGSLEAETMRFIAQNKSIPVPKVIDRWTSQDGSEAIVMEWIQGNTLETVWPSLNDDQMSCLGEQLREYIHELRSLRQPVHLLFEWWTL
ncbi:hypothetical protein JB92DRAFT_3157801 [Gautieria morchelliformis]|nr:hypothetical protein JB92DRAFT_3157801 [Gautieria morchelliformis]